MRTFVIRARKGPTHWQRIQSAIGSKDHFEVVAHSVINAFFTASDFRTDVQVFIILESSPDFPRTIKLSSKEGLSLRGFHEAAVIDVIELALKNSMDLQKDQSKTIAPGIEIYGFGFEKCIKTLLESSTIYLLDRKGSDIRKIEFPENPVFVLSDHLMMPKNSVKGLKRHGLQMLSLGKKMLFASQCIVLINHELDRK